MSEPRRVYDDLGTRFKVNVKNSQPGEAGTQAVCLNSPDKTLSCKNVSLVPGETKQIDLRTGKNLETGQYDLSVLNETIPVDVRPLPEPGDWINGTFVDIQLADVHHVENQTWNWTVRVNYHNGSTPITVSINFGTLSRNVPWDGSMTTKTWESNSLRPIRGQPVSATVIRVNDPYPRVDNYLFMWSHPTYFNTE